MSNQDLNRIMQLIAIMGKCLHEYGTSAHRLEAILNNIAKSLGVKGNFFSTPTYLAISLDRIDGSGEYDQLNQHIRVSPGDTNLYKLQLVDAVAIKVAARELDISQAIEQLKEIQDLPGAFPNWAFFLAFPLTSGALGVIFNGGAYEVILSTLIGSGVGLFAILAGKSTKIADIFVFLCSFWAMSLCTLIYHEFGAYNLQLVLIASLIVIIPGLDLTIAMNELATSNLVSGTARLMGTLMIFFKMAFGILVSAEIGKQIYSSPIEATNLMESLPPWSGIIAMVISCFCFTILFQARPKDFKWILLSGLVTIGTVKLTGHYLGQTLSIFISALAIGLLSNINARVRNRPAAVTLLPGIIFIVPGSIGLKGVNLIFNNDYLAGLEGGFQAMVISITIVAGLFLANTLITPRKEL